MKDFRRMNVSLSRARQVLITVGNIGKLYNGGKKWRNLIDTAYGYNTLYDCSTLIKN